MKLLLHLIVGCASSLQLALRPRLAHAWEGSSLFRGRLGSEAIPGPMLLLLALFQVLQLVWAHRWHLQRRFRTAHRDSRGPAVQSGMLRCCRPVEGLAGRLFQVLQLVWAHRWHLQRRFRTAHRDSRGPAVQSGVLRCCHPVEGWAGRLLLVLQLGWTGQLMNW